jgi:predicted CXXCH cytochrome family protein
MTGTPLRNLFWSSLLIGLGLLVVAGCGTPHERYKVLSFFFDGVPDPDAVKPTTDQTGPLVPVVTRVVKVHAPYGENNCAACHRTASGDIQEFSEAYKACVKCHPKVANERKLMHGPVAREACRWCHAPHESAEESLFRDTPIRVCTQCHDQQLLGNNPPEHMDGKTSCLKCHFGHGGDARYFLKQSAGTALAPSDAATRPLETEPALRLPPQTDSESKDAIGSQPGKEQGP